MSSGTPGAAALEYARQGRPVFPCHTPTHGGCSCHRSACSSPGKHPRTPNGLRDASTDPQVVAAWWRRWPDANVGVMTGRQSGLVVVDVDPDHGGIDSMRQLVAEHGPL
ncbi:MAG: bifunctional DNA primase/polymerase, partial [Microthrixaceae bacterium]